jgi:hypothetical protein
LYLYYTKGRLSRRGEQSKGEDTKQCKNRLGYPKETYYNVWWLHIL